MNNSVETEKIEISELDDFFFKEIKDIEYDMCEQSYPCQHSDIKVTYTDGSVKHFEGDGYTILRICKKFNKELSEHFKGLENYSFSKN